MTGFPKPQRWESKKYRDAARGQDCKMRLSWVCNRDTETTVLAHANGGGMGTKKSDHEAADMCSACHDVYDGRVVPAFWGDYTLKKEFERARLETIINRIERGILK